MQFVGKALGVIFLVVLVVFSVYLIVSSIQAFIKIKKQRHKHNIQHLDNPECLDDENIKVEENK